MEELVHAMSFIFCWQKVNACILCGNRGHLPRYCSQSLCFRCNRPGHTAKECDRKRSWQEDACHRCGLQGHFESVRDFKSCHTVACFLFAAVKYCLNICLNNCNPGFKSLYSMMLPSVKHMLIVVRFHKIYLSFSENLL